ncbi:MAG: MauE/DoxX family redox-associated membrane protein [Pyrinomonadaceae bacterium]
MHRSSLLKWIVGICRFGLVALFIFTAAAKLTILQSFVTNVGELLSASGIDYQRWSWPVTITVILSEICTALFLVWRRTVRLGATIAGILLASFAAYALYYVYVLHGEPLECGCFGGIIASQLGIKTALRNLALLIPAIIVWFGHRPRAASAQSTVRNKTVIV